MKLRVIIVDDEPLARERIRTFLAEEPDVEVLAERADGAAAVKAIEEHRPDLVFLDVQMPRLNGFEVLEALDAGALPAIIFTTAHDQHAIRAFEINAVDYLLKPYRQARFKKALQRGREQLGARIQTRTNPQLVALLAQVRGGAAGGPRIVVKSPDRILFLKPQEIDHIEAAGNYLILPAWSHSRRGLAVPGVKSHAQAQKRRRKHNGEQEQNYEESHLVESWFCPHGGRSVVWPRRLARP